VRFHGANRNYLLNPTLGFEMLLVVLGVGEMVPERAGEAKDLKVASNPGLLDLVELATGSLVNLVNREKTPFFGSH
jgi:hypothetical protein